MKKLVTLTLLLSLVPAPVLVHTTILADAGEVNPRPAGNDLPLSNPSEDHSKAPEGQLPVELTLRQARALALRYNPELAVSIWEERSGKARTVQAGLFPNPEIELEVENFGGSRKVENPDGTSEKSKRFDEAEMKVVLTQQIELGGKRSKRKKVAESEHNLLGWDVEARRLDTITAVTTAFIELLALQERLELTNGLAGLSQDVFNTVSERVNAGKVSPIEATRAKIALSTMQIEQERIKRELEAGRRHLAATWGSTDPGFQRVRGNLDAITALPPYEFLISRIEQNPDIARWEAEGKQREAALRLEKAQRYPDLTIGGGVKHLEESNDQTYIMGMALPLPFFNRNQGAIGEASINLQKARDERTAAEVNTRATLDETYQTLLSAYNEVTILRDTILPGAESAFNATNEGYREGKFSYLDVLDVQRGLFEAKDTYINSLRAYHRALIALERLTAENLTTLERVSIHEEE